jgi:ubiquinone/menaquinone biosynthesis C-methylase UbiE
MVPRGEIVTGDARALPYDDHEFGLVLMFTMLSSLKSRLQVLEAMREGIRVLEPGGRLLVYEPRMPNPLNRWSRLVRREWIDEAAAESGADVAAESLTVLPPLARRLGPATRAIYPVLARIPVLRSHRLFSIRLPDRSIPR